MQTFTAEQLRNATSAATAVVIEDYPFGFKLRCKMRIWIEYRKGKGFRVVRQTTNPRKAYEMWNAPKASTYNRVSMGLYVDEATGYIEATALHEYSDLADYERFKSRTGAVQSECTLSEDAERSFYYYYSVKKAYEDKRAELGVKNIYDADVTQEQKSAIHNAWLKKATELTAQGYDY